MKIIIVMAACFGFAIFFGTILFLFEGFLFDVLNKKRLKKQVGKGGY